MEVERSILAERLSRRRCLQLAAGVALGAAGFGVGGCGSGSGARDNGGSLTNRAFTVTDLGIPEELLTRTHLAALNERGDVLMAARSGVSAPSRVFRWRDGTQVDTGVPTADPGGLRAIGINDRGDVLVSSAGTGDSKVSLELSLWNEGTTTPLDLSGSQVNDPLMLTQQGAVIYHATAPWSQPSGPHYAPFIWRDGVSQPITIPGYDTAVDEVRIISVSDSGALLGSVEESASARTGLFVLKGEQVTFVDGLKPSPGPPGSEVGPLRWVMRILEMNDQGQILGQWEDHSGAPFDRSLPSYPFIWKNGRNTDLETDGMTISASRMNNLGQVIGYRHAPYDSENPSADLRTRATLWVNSKAYDLNTLIPKNSGWDLTYPTAINDQGQIIGQGSLNGSPRMFLMTPV
jgi:hypothetical protein